MKKENNRLLFSITGIDDQGNNKIFSFSPSDYIVVFMYFMINGKLLLYYYICSSIVQ